MTASNDRVDDKSRQEQETTPENAPLLTTQSAEQEQKVIVSSQKEPEIKIRPSFDNLDDRLPRSARGTFLFGMITLAVTFGGFAIWSYVAPLASAVHAQAEVVLEDKIKTIQHLEGGIVKQIFVQEGEHVDKGDILISLDPVQVKAQLQRIQNQLNVYQALQARLIAERDGLDEIFYPNELLANKSDPDIAKILQGQTNELVSRREILASQKSIRQLQIEQNDAAIKGLQAQKEARETQRDALKEELSDIQALFEKGLVTKSRMLSLKRDLSEAEGDIGRFIAEIARINTSINETRIELTKVDQQFREDVVNQLRDSDARVEDLKQQLVAARDSTSRLEIYSPQSGIVQDLRTATIGGVVREGEIIMNIAPTVGDLVVEARVSPTDIDNIDIGMEAETRFVSFNLRHSPAVFGKIISLSGDRLIEQQQGTAYYLARISVSKEELEKLGDNDLRAGMPVEVLVKTGERTLLEYITKPLTDALSRGLNEE
ncbi:MAG: HlyD family type I secretion periplasmic adaptor subunit [Cohaesibacter sp.]|nr:HlyD family type I secretion periplasmic adaptor subunit [Cohaesibacter sp.]